MVQFPAKGLTQVLLYTLLFVAERVKHTFWQKKPRLIHKNTKNKERMVIVKCFVKPRSDIRCNRFATSPRLTISTNCRGRNMVPDRSRRGCREVGD